MGYSLRTDRYRYTEWRDVKNGRVLAHELYDHRDDPRETTNRAGLAQHAEAIDDLAAQLSAIVKRPKLVGAGN